MKNLLGLFLLMFILSCGLRVEDNNNRKELFYFRDSKLVLNDSTNTKEVYKIVNGDKNVFVINKKTKSYNAYANDEFDILTEEYLLLEVDDAMMEDKFCDDSLFILNPIYVCVKYEKELNKEIFKINRGCITLDDKEISFNLEVLNNNKGFLVKNKKMFSGGYSNF